jgi:hypothetical protein
VIIASISLSNFYGLYASSFNNRLFFPNVWKSELFRQDDFAGSSVWWKAEQTDNRETFALTIQIRTDPVGRGRKRKGMGLVKHRASLTWRS